MRVLVTGGAGFIGHHVVEHILKNTDWDITILDNLNYASRGFDRLREIGAYDIPRVRIFTTDIAGAWGIGLAKEIGDPDFIIHLAAETHVDNSIAQPWPFVKANVVGTFNLLEFARTRNNLRRLLYFSTDEVFGPAPDGVAYREWDRYNSTNPYSATKAAGEELCLAWANTYRLPVIITHTMNNFGERQHPEKFIPMALRRILSGEIIPIHASADKKRSGSRFYIHCRNVAAAVLFLLENSEVREKYNIVGEREVTNLSMVEMLAEFVGKKANYELVDFHSSRPGHDLRYALDGSRMATLGWQAPVGFEQSLRKTAEWTLQPEHAHWLQEKS